VVKGHCRIWSNMLSASDSSDSREKKRAEARRGQGQCWGEAGDGSRELLPWTANPGAQKHFDPEHPLVRDSKGISAAALCSFLFHCLIQFVLRRVLAPIPQPSAVALARALAVP
jgi:hypothetical protein